jgi:hypothetical protein
VLEEHGPARGGSLVDREDVLLRHLWPPVACRVGLVGGGDGAITAPSPANPSGG